MVTMVLERELPGHCMPFRLVAEEDADSLAGADMSAVLESVVSAVNGAFGSLRSPPGAAVTRDDVLTTLRKGSFGGGADAPFWVLDPIDGKEVALKWECDRCPWCWVGVQRVAVERWV